MNKHQRPMTREDWVKLVRTGIVFYAVLGGVFALVYFGGEVVAVVLAVAVVAWLAIVFYLVATDS